MSEKGKKFLKGLDQQERLVMRNALEHVYDFEKKQPFSFDDTFVSEDLKPDEVKEGIKLAVERGWLVEMDQRSSDGAAMYRVDPDAVHPYDPEEWEEIEPEEPETERQRTIRINLEKREADQIINKKRVERGEMTAEEGGFAAPDFAMLPLQFVEESISLSEMGMRVTLFIVAAGTAPMHQNVFTINHLSQKFSLSLEETVNAVNEGIALGWIDVKKSSTLKKTKVKLNSEEVTW